MVVIRVMQSTGSELPRQGIHRTMFKELSHLLVLFVLFHHNTTTRILFFQEKKSKSVRSTHSISGLSDDIKSLQ